MWACSSVPPARGWAWDTSGWRVLGVGCEGWWGGGAVSAQHRPRLRRRRSGGWRQAAPLAKAAWGGQRWPRVRRLCALACLPAAGWLAGLRVAQTAGHALVRMQGSCVRGCCCARQDWVVDNKRWLSTVTWCMCGMPLVLVQWQLAKKAHAACHVLSAFAPPRRAAVWGSEDAGVAPCSDMCKSVPATP